MTIEQITLLSKEEYKEHKDIIPLLDGVAWWLRTPGNDFNYACGVDGEGTVSAYYSIDDIFVSVRPVLLLNLEPTEPEFWCKPEKLVGRKVTYGAFTWTVLEAFNSQVCVLCDETIVKDRFNDTNNDWDNSELKAWLETEGLKLINDNT